MNKWPMANKGMNKWFYLICNQRNNITLCANVKQEMPFSNSKVVKSTIPGADKNEVQEGPHIPNVII